MSLLSTIIHIVHDEGSLYDSYKSIACSLNCDILHTAQQEAARLCVRNIGCQFNYFRPRFVSDIHNRFFFHNAVYCCDTADEMMPARNVI
jgi:hypothetical protein